MALFTSRKTQMVTPDKALPGRHEAMVITERHLTSAEQVATAPEVAARFQDSLQHAGYGAITTEIAPAGEFSYAEPYHQQYLEANPGGYCGLGGTGVSCPVGLPGASAEAG